jgi:hypothetical protein
MDHLSDIVRSLTNDGIRFIITGGVAMVLRGAERMTMDLDISVERDSENLDRFLKLMHKMGMRPRAPIAPETLLDADVLKSFVEEKSALVFTFIHPDEPYRQIDVFIIDEMSYDRLYPLSDDMQIHGKPVRVLHLDGLIHTKMQVNPPRDTDIWDLNVLKKLKEKKS